MSASTLYEACRTGDIHTVQQLLPTLSINEINQIESNGSTCLHAAASCNHPQVVKVLLNSGAIRSIIDKDGHTAMHVAATEEIKNLFPRSFTASHARFLTDIKSEQTIEWILLKDGQYGWWYKSQIVNEDVILAVDRIVEDTRFSVTASTHKTEYFLNKARQTQDPKWLIQAYSSETGLYQVINRAMAETASTRIPFDATDDFRAFAGVLSRHSALKQYRYTGKCYRGMKLSNEDFQKNYKVGQKLLVKPFMSTSKSRAIAEQFATSAFVESRLLSIVFIYTIPEYTLYFDDSVALDISPISEYPHEEEILILPYTSLIIVAINNLPSGLIEVEFGWYSARGNPEYKKMIRSMKINKIIWI
ncbi:hypothetical protein I4U23_015534 [Adineta vaga]|nr:hypothetical protein I4U23_015534 [Adineta vaga]